MKKCGYFGSVVQWQNEKKDAWGIFGTPGVEIYPRLNTDKLRLYLSQIILHFAITVRCDTLPGICKRRTTEPMKMSSDNAGIE